MSATLVSLAVLAGCTDPTPKQVTSTSNLLDAPPVPTSGYQIPFGPFDVKAGSEVQLCRTFKLPNEDIEAFNRIQIAMAQGSHHFILFRSRFDYPDEVFPCWGTVNFDEWDFMMDVNKAGGDDWQLDDGQAFIVQPHQQIMIQSHFVNATSVQSPAGGMAYLNLHKTPLEDVKHELHGIFTVNTRIKIPPNGTFTTTKKCTPSRDINIVAMTGHFHARGVEFKVDKVLNSTYPGEEDTNFGTIYDNTNWDAPTFQLYKPVSVVNGIQEALQFTCSYDNTNPASVTFDKTVGFGGHADVQEHCNLFFQYYETVPKDSDPIKCVEGSGGW